MSSSKLVSAYQLMQTVTKSDENIINQQLF